LFYRFANYTGGLKIYNRGRVTLITISFGNAGITGGLARPLSTFVPPLQTAKRCWLLLPTTSVPFQTCRRCIAASVRPLPLGRRNLTLQSASSIGKTGGSPKIYTRGGYGSFEVTHNRTVEYSR